LAARKGGGKKKIRSFYSIAQKLAANMHAVCLQENKLQTFYWKSTRESRGLNTGIYHTEFGLTDKNHRGEQNPMAHDAYMWITAQKQGIIRGPVTLAGRKDSILVFLCSHEIVSPRDPLSGLPTGQRQHKPLTIRKDIDCSSPLLMNSLCTNENIKNLVLQFWHKDRLGKEVAFYTIRLTNASIASIRLEMPEENPPETTRHPIRENVSFCYEKIEWTWEADM
jgi:type VI secretion system secreted protein Hcp